jgi:O-antigen ligase
VPTDSIRVPKSFTYLAVFFIAGLADPYAFLAPINFGIGPAIFVIDTVILLFFVQMIRFWDQFLSVVRRSKFNLLIVVWTLWGLLEVLRGAPEFGLTVAITESKVYVFAPLFCLWMMWFLVYRINVTTFYRRFLHPATITVLVVLVISVAVFMANPVYKILTTLSLLDPQRYAYMEESELNTWVRFLNSYSASFLAIVIPMFILAKFVHAKEEAPSFLIIGLCVVGIMLSQMRTAWVVFVIGMIVVLAIVGLSNRKARFKAGMVVVLFVLIGGGTLAYLNNEGVIDVQQSISPFVAGSAEESQTFVWRQEIWALALARWSDQPLLGLGYGGNYEDASGESITAPHSSYVAILAKQGIVGLSLYLALLLSFLIYFLREVFRQGRSSTQYGAIFGVVVILSMFVYSYTYEVTPLQWLLLGYSHFRTKTWEQWDETFEPERPCL